MTDHDKPERVEHRFERRYEVTATPEHVWDAIATAEGISAWMVPTRLDPQVGGEVAFDLGDFTLTGVVTDYTPNERFGYQEPWPIADDLKDIPAGMIEWFDSIGASMTHVYTDLEAASPIASEFLIEAASGGSCVIRVVMSAYGNGADWENEFWTEMVAGTSEYFDRLAARFERRTV